MKKILLPTDFSDNAWNAICYAQLLFKEEQCDFHILHTYTPTFYRLDYMMGGPTYSAIPDMGVEVAQAGLEKTLIDIKNNFDNPKHSFQTFSTFNTPVNEIIERTTSKKFDLIIMGTQGATGAKEIFLGSHTVHVIRRSTTPVLAVPQGYAFKELKSVVFSTDYLDTYQGKNLKILKFLVKLHHAKLTVLHIKEEYELSDEQKDNKQSLNALFKNLNPDIIEERGKLMPNAIQEYIEEHKSELLIMMNKKHSFFERILNKQNLDTIGYHTKIPLLVLPETAEIKK